jgi:CrcB protein
MKTSLVWQLLLVGSGGFLGSVLRFAVSGGVHSLLPSRTFPFGTVVVNILGCLIIGFLGGQADLRQVFGPQARLFLFIGILGGFTTFSTFAYETFQLSQDTQTLKALGNVLVQVVLGFLGAWLGYVGARYL